MIDPQLQANQWIKKMERGGGMYGHTKKQKKTESQSYDEEDQTTKRRVLEIKPTMDTKHYATMMEKFIEFGFPIILQNIGETIDNVFTPLLDKNITEEAGMKKIKWGENDLQYNDEFMFYMTTKLSNPHYSPEICVKITLINFTVTD